MSITNKLFGMLGLTEVAQQTNQQEINIYGAIESHIAWKVRLTNYLEGRSNEVLHSNEISVDYRCELGKWIHGPGKARFGDVMLFQKMTEEHARFHLDAARVVDAHQAKDTILATQILSEDFSKHSRNTVDYLTKLHDQTFGKQAARSLLPHAKYPPK